MSEKLSDMSEAQTTKDGNQVGNEQGNNEKSEAIEQQNALSDISISEVQTIVDGSQDVNKETNEKKFKAVEQEHAQALSHIMEGDESPPKKRKFEGLSILKDIVQTENKGVARRTRSHFKSKLVAKDGKIGTISRPIDSNDIIEMESIDCNDVIELDSDKEEATINVTTDTESPVPQQLELTRKRKSFSDTHVRGLVDCIAEASELAKKAMAELDEKGKELQATRGEVAHLKKQVRAVRDKHVDHVSQLQEALSVANANHVAEVRRLADEHPKARTTHDEEMKAERASMVAKLQEEHAAAVAQLTEHLKKEHADGVARLKEEHADGVARLKEEHAAACAAEVAKLQNEHAAAAARLKEEHAADVARVKDAADREVQDAKKNIVLHLFPKLDVSLLNDQSSSSREISLPPERPKLKGDPADRSAAS